MRSTILFLLLALGACTANFAPNPPLASIGMPDDSFIMADGARLPVRTWFPPDGRPPRVVLLALHGFNDSRDQWALPAPVLAEAGIAVVAPDQRGFAAAPGRGVWPGTDTLVADAATMLRTLRARYPIARLYAAGESMGGAVLMVLSARPDAPPVDGWILLSPAVYGRDVIGPLVSAGLAVATALAPGYYTSGNEVTIRVHPSDNREALLALIRNPLTIRRTRLDALRGLVDLMDAAEAAGPRLPPNTFVAYGARDDIVPPAATGRMWHTLPPGPRRALYPAGYHLLTRDRARGIVINDLIAWIDTPGEWLPSGADISAAGWAATHH